METEARERIGELGVNRSPSEPKAHAFPTPPLSLYVLTLKNVVIAGQPFLGAANLRRFAWGRQA